MQGPVITEIALIDRIIRPNRGAFRSESLPGHLIHFCTAGRVEQRSGGVIQRFGKGDAIWYHENESVEGSVIDPPWEFYTINFRAPSLLPPPLDQRVFPVSQSAMSHTKRLLEIWRDVDGSAVKRHLQVHAHLLQIIAEILPTDPENQRIDTPSQLWWEIETRLRACLHDPIDLRHLETLSGRSQRSISRACRLATGLSPMKRVKQVRLSYARGLVQLSDLSMTEIAMRIGYPRVQEFSRDYHILYGTTPSQDRKSGPDYQNKSN
ncbi:AraC family transcriptional regulator [Rhodopirellula sallentina SM41]|uniref:AraC family transcriptional regulator n=2 Tax=Rhodopirellula TaxID=265488 RepID=M5TX64_9BACT|nr:AraC family transcriptional regulator [Rhodopirellula sallentina SM41]